MLMWKEMETGASGGGSGVESIEAFTKATTGEAAFSIPTTKKAIGIVMHYTSSTLNKVYGVFAFDGIYNNHPKVTDETTQSFYDGINVTYTDSAINFSKNVGSTTWKGYIVY